ncbi:MAG: HAMP domain-containing sensor histidine kinase, partial [Planctomycetota bacterium]
MDTGPHNIQQQQDFERAIEALPEALQRLCLSGRSVQNLSHLIKNTLQVTSGSIEIVELGLQQKQYDHIERSWDIFEANFTQMKKFILDLIKYTKQYPLSKTACKLNPCVDNAIRSCEYALKNNAVEIQFQKDETIPSASLDADRIEEMIANLLTHALDNLPEHAGTISITTTYLKEHRQIQLSVRDDGPGLPDEIIRSLAEPCERTRNMCGTGFDIPLAKLYIEQHAGYMEFESS